MADRIYIVIVFLVNGCIVNAEGNVCGKGLPGVVSVCTSDSDPRRQLFIPLNNETGEGCECKVKLVETPNDMNDYQITTRNLVDNCDYHVNVEYNSSSHIVNCSTQELQFKMRKSEVLKLEFSGYSSIVQCFQIIADVEGTKITIECGSVDNSNQSTTQDFLSTYLPKTQTSLPNTTTSPPETITFLSKTPTSLPKTPTSLPKTPTSLPKTPTSLPETASLLKTSASRKISTYAISTSPSPSDADTTVVNIVTIKSTDNPPDKSEESLIPLIISGAIGGFVFILIIIIIICCCICRRKEKVINDYQPHDIGGNVTMENELYILAYGKPTKHTKPTNKLSPKSVGSSRSDLPIQDSDDNIFNSGEANRIVHFYIPQEVEGLSHDAITEFGRESTNYSDDAKTHITETNDENSKMKNCLQL